MVETEAALFVVAHQPGKSTALRDLSSKLVVEEQLELPLQHAQPLLTRIIEHIDQFLFAISTSSNDLPQSPSPCRGSLILKTVSSTGCRFMMT